ncbi:hypothetical protein FACS1894152_7270 [Bacilli bacterium]|nr:hypothetical protein FACS1894152_7270 [Bacilli bacterium]
MIEVGLKENYKDYDMFFPVIVRDREENMNDNEISIDKLNQFDGWTLSQLKNMVPDDNDKRYISQEPQVFTSFGEYRVTSDLFNATSYNEYLSRMVTVISNNISRTGIGKNKPMPLMQINQASLAGTIDRFIREKLFDEQFDPFIDNNWRVLMDSKLIEHTGKELSKVVYSMQNNVDVSEAVVEKHYFSQVPKLKMRENFALDIVKSIYKKTSYPSNKGGFEKAFLEACDTDGDVSAIIKINETQHDFAKLRYIRTDGMLSSYLPDFMVRIKNTMYMVETKSEKDIDNPNVQAKWRGALNWIEKINKLQPEQRDNMKWAYVLLDDKTFYTLHSQNATMQEILERYVLTKPKIDGTLF